MFKYFVTYITINSECLSYNCLRELARWQPHCTEPRTQLTVDHCFQGRSIQMVVTSVGQFWNQQLVATIWVLIDWSIQDGIFSPLSPRGGNPQFSFSIFLFGLLYSRLNLSQQTLCSCVTCWDQESQLYGPRPPGSTCKCIWGVSPS